MRYLLEPIGAQFTNEKLSRLGERFTARSKDGYKLHSVFQITQPGCLGIGTPTSTYVAVYVQE